MTSVGVSGFLGNAGLSDILPMSESVLLAKRRKPGGSGVRCF